MTWLIPVSNKQPAAIHTFFFPFPLAELISLEMETFHLYDLARCSGGSVRAAAFCIALAERYSNAFIDPALMEERERAGGLAALTALASMPLQA